MPGRGATRFGVRDPAPRRPRRGRTNRGSIVLSSKARSGAPAASEHDDRECEAHDREHEDHGRGLDDGVAGAGPRAVAIRRKDTDGRARAAEISTCCESARRLVHAALAGCTRRPHPRFEARGPRRPKRARRRPWPRELGNLYPRLVVRSGLAPVPALGAAGVKARVFEHAASAVLDDFPPQSGIGLGPDRIAYSPIVLEVARIFL